ncbi:SGNH hydrolase-type esterase domain-containing protein [Xylaria grammica]|nr:SGNH hydrolase-type esterase domain-containing protein [Xylaria grammica]
MSSLMEKPLPSQGRSRFGFLKTKRAIAVLTVLVIVSVVLIALGATHELSPHNNTSVSNGDSMGDSLGGNNSSSNAGNDAGSSGGSNDDSTSGGHNNTSSVGNGNGSNNDSDDDDDGGDDVPSKGNSTNSLWQPKNSSSIADGTPLRIMCLGASIVRGEVSSDSNGFRKTLRGDLAKLGVPINMVGSQRNGEMPDNDMEAYGGNRISQIHSHAEKIVPKQQPNVFVINVGTNNVLQYKDTDVAGEHMEAFIDYLLEASPRATVVLSTLLTNTVPNREPLILDINRQFRELYQKYENKTVVLAELHPSEGLPGRPTTDDISSDGSHPTDQGYEIMGHILADAVKDADERGYLRWPENGLSYDGDIGRVDASAAESTEAPAPTTTDAASGTSSDSAPVTRSDAAAAAASTTDAVASEK